MKSISRSHHGTLNELNITPLLDLVFVLLVIFIITTPQLVNNLEMSLPSGKPSPKSTPPKINRILINDAGQIFLNNLPLELPALKSQLQRLKSEDHDPAIVVKAEDNVDYQRMVNVLDTLQQLDITKVGLATTEEPTTAH
jgi:biopolymer transport protein ExbD